MEQPRPLSRILSHYAEDFEMSSPVIVAIAGEPSGTLKGKDQVRAYWAKALQHIPDLRFEPMTILVGVNSVTLYYKGARGRGVSLWPGSQSRESVRALCRLKYSPK